MITKRPLALAAFCSSGLIAVTLAAAGSAVTNERGACRTVAVSGPVELRAIAAIDAPGRAVRRGEALPAGAVVWTGDDGQATVVCDTATMIVGPRSTVELSPASREATRMTQRAGRVTYEVARRGMKHFEVVTPYLVAGVKGTVFAVAVADRGAAVEVLEGLVEVTSIESGERIDVGAGESARMSGDDPSGKIERIRPQANERRTPEDRKYGQASRTPPTEATRIAFDGSATERENAPPREDDLIPSFEDDSASDADTTFSDVLDRFDSEAKANPDAAKGDPVNDDPVDDTPAQGGSILRPGILDAGLSGRAPADSSVGDERGEEPCLKSGTMSSPGNCAGARTAPPTSPGAPGGGGGGGGQDPGQGVGAGGAISTKGDRPDDAPQNGSSGASTGLSALDESPVGDPHAEPPPADEERSERSKSQRRHSATSGRGR